MEDRQARNKLRQVIMTAEGKEVISREEAGFVINLVERFRSDIDKKFKQLHMLQGEINQLRVNEQIIINLIDSLIAAAERDAARQEAVDRIRSRGEEDTNVEAEEAPVEE
jgi:hypothetical protein